MNAGSVNRDNVAVVLCRPKLSENIGTAARAAANMGIGRLVLVAPYRMEPHIMIPAATRAGEHLIENLTVHQDLAEALGEFDFVVGTTARLGSHRGPFVTPRDMAQHMIGLTQNNRVALLFGPERTGLTTEDLRLCQMIVTIPTASREHSSLNLAQAVLVLAYELLIARTDDPVPSRIKMASNEEILAMYDTLSRTLLRIKFLPDDNTDHWLMSFKRIFNRAGLTHGDCNLLRGMCRQIEWALNNRDKLDLDTKSGD